MITAKPTISKEVNAMAEALNTFAQNDFIDSATPLTLSLSLCNQLGLDL